MKTSIKKSKKTSEIEKKEFIKFCRICKIIAITMSGGMFICSLTFIYEMLIDIVLGNRWNTFLFSAENAITLIGMCISFTFIAKMFDELKTGSSPFTYSLADKIKSAAKIMLITGIIGYIIKIVSSVLFYSGIYNDVDLLIYEGEIACLIIGFMLISLAYIFRYGCKLQQESDETL